jgi:type II secretory pathway pseudopilin PulG
MTTCIDHRAREGARAGFTLIDLLISAAIFSVLLIAFGKSVSGLFREQTSLNTVDRMQDMAARCLDDVFDDLHRSGVAAANGVNYPYLFEDGAAEAPFDDHAHAPADKDAEAGDPDFGPNREIVFCLPADLNGDNVPDVDGSGQLMWDADEHSFVVVTEGGVNYLQHRVNGGEPRTLASHVERVTFDDHESSGFVVPQDAIRVRIWFRMEDGTGHLHRYAVETTTKLRNGG